MDPRTEIREFLTSRRARMSPDRVGLVPGAGKRRVPGLRRAEVAVLAGVSAEYYTQLERGNVRGVSDGVLEALARALALDENERAHLLNLVEATKAAALRSRRPAPAEVRPDVQHLLDAIAAPALLHNGRRDVLAANRYGRALFSDVLRERTAPVNHSRFLFLDPRAREFYVDWELMTEYAVALLRAELGRTPSDDALSELIDELLEQSPRFRALWAVHDVRREGGSTLVRVFHPDVGRLSLKFEALEVVADRGLTVGVYAPEPGSPCERRLAVLVRNGGEDALGETRHRAGAALRG